MACERHSRLVLRGLIVVGTRLDLVEGADVIRTGSVVYRRGFRRRERLKIPDYGMYERRRLRGHRSKWGAWK